MHPDEQFRQIPDFMLYAVSNYGRVINLRFDREMTYSPTEYGDLTVGLMKNGTQHRRSVKVLTAKAWVGGESVLFDTVINMDGDRSNNVWTNLSWRPRWFAWKYHRQFENPPTWCLHGPVECIQTRRVYENIYHCAVMTGAMFEDIRHSITWGTQVFPQGSIYRFAK